MDAPAVDIGDAGAFFAPGLDEQALSLHSASLKTFYQDVFEQDDTFQGQIAEAQARVAAGGEPTVRLLLSLDDLRHNNRSEVDLLLRNPLVGVRLAQTALAEVVAEKGWLESKSAALALEQGKNVEDNIRVGVVGSFGSHFVSPRGLKAHLVGTLVCVEGIVTKISLVQPKLAKSVHYCPKTTQQQRREYRDATALSGLPTTTVIPTKDENGNALELEFGLSVYRNYQRLTVQEMPERAPLGQLPRSVDVIVEDDLVDRVKPGDRVHASGIFRALSGAQVPAQITGLFKVVIVCNAIQTVGRDVGGLTMTHEDIVNINKVAEEGNVFKRMVRSLAPSIYGHEHIKEALLLVLFGGMERNLANGAHLRGDINVLLVGDPSTAKSQMLRFMLGIAPLAISTTGRGSTGVGLTAAVTRDVDTGESRLEAGAMVLADRGLVLIDEFDKMSDGDRVALHEVMEQQTVTIAKAGIHAQLNARCSVVAAANPIYGSYDKDLSPQKNVGLPDSLLSRFDCLFIVLDNANSEQDRRIADHVLRMHRYQRPGHEGKPLPLYDDALAGQLLEGLDDHAEGDETSPVFQKHNPLLHASYGSGRSDKLFHTEFIRKYVNYAKSRVKPTLTDEASAIIVADYVELRQEQATKTLPITPRCLETMIRLATAHAKARLSALVEPADCYAARAILKFALYNDTGGDEERKRDQGTAVEKKTKHKTGDSQKKKKKKKARRVDSSSESEEEEDDDDDNDEEDDPARAAQDELEAAAAEDMDVPAAAPQLSGEARLSIFTRALAQLFHDSQKDELPMREIIEAANKALASQHRQAKAYNPDEAEANLRVLDEQNKVMYRDGIAWRI